MPLYVPGTATAAAVLVNNKFSAGPLLNADGTMPNRSAESVHMPSAASTAWVGDRVFLQPSNGYYDGTTWVTAAAPDLRPENVLKGKSILGINGNAKTTVTAGEVFLGLVTPSSNTASMIDFPVTFTVATGGTLLALNVFLTASGSNYVTSSLYSGIRHGTSAAYVSGQPTRPAIVVNSANAAIYATLEFVSYNSSTGVISATLRYDLSGAATLSLVGGSISINAQYALLV